MFRKVKQINIYLKKKKNKKKFIKEQPQLFSNKTIILKTHAQIQISTT